MKRGNVKQLSLRSRSSALLLLCCVVSSTARAQTAREASIIDAEKEKATHLTPGTAPHGEQVFDKVESHIIDRIFSPDGFSLKLGGMPSGAGFSLGPGYTRTDLLGHKLTSESSIVGSIQQWYRADSSLQTNPLFSRHMTLRLEAGYENARSFPYFGQSIDPAFKPRTNFRREFTTIHAVPLFHFFGGKITAGYQPGGLLVNVGPGNTSVSPSADAVYTPANTPGLGRQSNFFTGTSMVDFNNSKDSFSNEDGYHLQAADTQFWDKSGGNSNFHLLQTQLIYTKPFMNGMRAITLRAKNETTFHDGSQVVPFYLQPTLGGPNDLRGFERYYYYGNGSSLVSAEYRWSVAGTLEMAVFGDTGNIYSRPGLIGVRNLKSDGGIGFRVKNKQTTVMRVDIGVSTEGVKLWFVFNEAFPRLFRSY